MHMIVLVRKYKDKKYEKTKEGALMVSVVEKNQEQWRVYTGHQESAVADQELSAEML